MIPTMLLVGLLIGRAWVVPLGGLAWACLLLATGTIGLGECPLAALLGAGNAAAGALIRRAITWPLRRPRAIG